MSVPATAATSDQTAADVQSVPSCDDLVKTVLVEFRGSPAMWASVGGTAAEWRIPENTATKIFGPKTSAGIPPEIMERMLKNAILKKVRLVEGKTNSKDAVGLQIHGLPRNEFTTTGDEHHVVMLGEGKTKNLDVFNTPGDPALAIQWMMEYPDFNQNNIRSEPHVMRLNGSDYYFVHNVHPVVKMLYKNQQDLGTSITPCDMVNKEWYRVEKETFEDACNSLEHNVFDRTPHIFDLTNLAMRIRRLDNKGWLEPPMLYDEYLRADKEQKKKLYKSYIDSPLYLLAKLEFHYTLPPMAAMQ